jgi:hypothetical protein
MAAMNQRLIAFSRFLLGIALVFAAHFVASFLTPASLPFRRAEFVYRPLLLVFLLGGFSLLLTGFDRVSGSPLAAMGLALRRPWLRDLWTGALLGAGMVTAAVAVIEVFGTLTVAVRGTAHAALLAVVVGFVLVTGALSEEVAFRGYPLQRLVEAIGPTSAAIVLSVLFGAVHLLNPHVSGWAFLNTVLIGLLLSFAYLRTRSLWMPIGIHLFWNTTLGLVFGLPVSGLRDFSVVIRARAEGPLWLTGGDYGIEASAMGAVVIGLGVLLIAVYVPQRESLQGQAAVEAGDLHSPEESVSAPASSLMITDPPAPGQPPRESLAEAPAPKDSDS